jgi:hypothetical protein
MQNPDNVVNKLEPKLSVLFKLQEFLASFKPYDANEASALGPTSRPEGVPASEAIQMEKHGNRPEFG